MGMWYKRSEAQKRFSFFFSSTTLAGAFGGLLAYGLSHMAGDRGYSGWRWVFIIEGVITAAVAIVLFFCLPDFPEETKWLTEEEREFVREKLAKDVGKSAHHVKMGWREIKGVLSDCEWKLSPCIHPNTDCFYRQGHSRWLHVLWSHRPRVQLRLLCSFDYPELWIQWYVLRLPMCFVKHVANYSHQRFKLNCTPFLPGQLHLCFP